MKKEKVSKMRTLRVWPWNGHEQIILQWALNRAVECTNLSLATTDTHVNKQVQVALIKLLSPISLTRLHKNKQNIKSKKALQNEMGSYSNFTKIRASRVKFI